MPPAEQGDEELIDDVPLSDDHFANFSGDLVAGGFQVFNGLEVVIRCCV